MDAGERSVELGVLLFLGDSLLSVYSRQIVYLQKPKANEAIRPNSLWKTLSFSSWLFFGLIKMCDT